MELGTCLQPHVEWRLGGARTEPNPPAVVTSRSLASPVCAPKAAATSCDIEVGTQTMDHGRYHVEDAAKRMATVFCLVAGYRLDHHAGAIWLQCLLDMSRRASRIAGRDFPSPWSAVFVGLYAGASVCRL